MFHFSSEFLALVLVSVMASAVSETAFAQESSIYNAEQQKSSVLGISSAMSANSIEQTQIRTYNSNDNGHGLAAEDANATSDRLRGKQVKQTGPLNKGDNPDRIVNNSEMVQTKYCRNAYDTVHKSFNKHTGMYRYPGQQLEVPKDQYDDAIKYMEDKIREGKVEGISDPSDARRIVRKGKYTYRQAVEIVKPGTFESVKYDAKTGIISSTIAGGITFGLVFETAIRNGASAEEAVMMAIKESGYMAGSNMVVHIISKQLLRTNWAEGLGEAIISFGRKSIEYLEKTETGRNIVKKTLESSTGKEILTNTSKRIGSQMISSTVLTSAGMLIICTVPDVWKASKGEVTWGTVAKRSATNVTAIVTGIAGAAGGAAVGSYINAGYGTAIGGLIGGVAGGMAGSFLVTKTISLFEGEIIVE